MDKSPTELDPKLKEAYDRVMGTVVTPQSAASPTPAMPTPPQSTQSAQALSPTPPTLTSTPQEKTGFVNTKKKKGVSPIIIALGIIVLLIVYAFVWIKIFNVQLF